MAEYKLELTTGDMQYAGTLDHIFVTLFGNEGQSERTELNNFGIDFKAGKTGTYTMKTKSSLGKLLLVKVEKDPYFVFPEDEWYCSKMVVTTPEGDVILFPCYRWISRGELVELRGGRAMKVFEEEHPLLVDHRKKELTLKKSLYQWKIMSEGLLHISSFKMSELPAEIRFSKSKIDETRYERMKTGIELKLKGLFGSTERWKNIEDMKKIFWFKKTTMSEYVAEHWKDDDFYGYQFLNGINPNVIKRCSELPPNFPVTEEMVKQFLEKGSSLQKEMEKGNIFLSDQKKMDGIPPRKNNGEPLHVTAGLCLFYLNPENKLMPIAIQLHQQPSEQNPIFLPSDTETDWLLAKMYIKNADFMDHEAVHHLMRTHLVAEACAVATFRNLPVIHPLYKRTSLHEDWNQSLTSTTEAVVRLKLWNIIASFVKSVVEYYYPSDSEVGKDTELQDWIDEIFTRCILGNTASGFPSCFNTVEEVIRFVTMVIFTVTAQHAAVNNGQFDYGWMPNNSLLLLKPPPTTKGQSSMKTILETLPNIGDTVKIQAMEWTLSSNYTDSVPMGAYPEERFHEPALKQMIKNFQAELSYLSEEITARNSQLEVPYTYLNPTQIENSITI
ncbi:hydroperoxide isomerase ALOXE3-like isoform X1 [Lates japonicus]|uniref:Hydroperoxide isomerase ALOXE3-like isoform X1 n=1 Tax=Lates japonicus TaxID=270547 RepID=A0AAD3M7W5_LATJO|nr:hydroperoxide isomerase ALOXE3-like isoform X1 [Lates japonicus]